MTTITDLKNSPNNHSLPPHWVTQWLLFVLKKPPVFLFSNPDYVPNDDEVATFFAGIERMQQGTPLAYLTQRADFWSLGFYVNEHTLIPRPDTERLVETALLHIKNHAPTPKKILDLGTGSGCIAVSLAKALPNWQVYATDQSPQALMVAKTNAKHHNVCVHFFCGNWFEPLPKERFSLIVTNPPYIAEGDDHLLALTAEPLSALVAKENGLADIAHIIEQSPRFLTDGGVLFIEHGHTQAKQVQALFANRGFCQVNTVSDYGGNERLTLGTFCATMTI